MESNSMNEEVELKHVKSELLESPKIVTSDSSSENLIPKSIEYLMLTILCVAFALDVFWLNSVNLMVDTLRKEFNMTPSELQWIVSGYALAFSSFLLLMGRISDLTNCKYVLLFGILWFALFTGLCGFSATSFQLIIFRSLKGLGAAITVPASLTLIVTNFGSSRTRISKEIALTAYSLAASLGNVSGQILGGAITFAIGWKWAFFIMSLFTFLIFLVGCLVIPKYCVIPEKDIDSNDGSKSSNFISNLDVPGALLASTGFVLLCYSISAGNSPIPWSNYQILLPFFVSIFCLISFPIWEHYAPHPLMPLYIWTKKFSLVIFVSFAYGAFRMCFLYFSALQLQNILGLNVLQASLYSLTLGVSATIATLINGKLMKIFSLRRFVLIGTGLEIFACFLLIFNESSSNFWMFSFTAYICGLSGLIFVFNGLNIKTFELAEAKNRGLYGGIFNTSIQLSGGIGIAIITSLMEAIIGPKALAEPAGYRVAFISVIIILSLGFIASFKL
eukprot:NODE_29_length_37665_cov_1.081563.p7 type:complete len:504 gc:universal NODE_29_length_37665_cov_1.081563:31781-30270(-)